MALVVATAVALAGVGDGSGGLCGRDWATFCHKRIPLGGGMMRERFRDHGMRSRYMSQNVCPSKYTRPDLLVSSHPTRSNIRMR